MEAVHKASTGLKDTLTLVIIGGIILIILNPVFLLDIAGGLAKVGFNTAAKGLEGSWDWFMKTFQGSLRPKPKQTNPYVPKELRGISTDVLRVDEVPAQGTYLSGSGTRKKK